MEHRTVEKEGKRFEAVTDTKREKSYKGETNEKVNKRGFPKSRSGYQ